jgi:hypothetical protein
VRDAACPISTKGGAGGGGGKQLGTGTPAQDRCAPVKLYGVELTHLAAARLCCLKRRLDPANQRNALRHQRAIPRALAPDTRPRLLPCCSPHLLPAAAPPPLPLPLILSLTFPAPATDLPRTERRERSSYPPPRRVSMLGTVRTHPRYSRRVARRRLVRSLAGEIFQKAERR